MSLSLLNPFNKVADMVDKFVIDKDAKIERTTQLETLKQQVNMKELVTKTIPGVEAI